MEEECRAHGARQLAQGYRGRAVKIVACVDADRFQDSPTAGLGSGATAGLHEKESPMAWIETIDEDNWDAELEALRPRVTDPSTGQIDNIMSIHSLDVGSLKAHLALYMQAMRGTASLPKAEREMIALVVSKSNECHY